MEKDMKLRKFIATTISEYLNENINQSQFLSKSEKYGSYEGIVHSDLEKIKNWFLKRGIDYTKYINHIELLIS